MLRRRPHSLRKPTLCILLSLVAISFVGCGDDDSPAAPTQPNIAAIIQEFGLSPLPAIPYPANNTFNAERISLGRLLFYDPILGGESDPTVKQAAGITEPYRYRANDMACATCHHPNLGFADARRLGAGVGGAQFNDLDLGADRVVPAPSLVTQELCGEVPRNSPSILNVAFNGKGSIVPVADSFQFMDGRVAGGLEEQAILPITSRDEMAGDAYGANFTDEEAQNAVTARIRAIPEYVSRFHQAFPNEISVAGDITIEHIGRAIAAFEREIITPGSRYDRFVAGDAQAFTDQERFGFEVFFGKALCGDCHGGPMLADFAFYVQGVGDDYESILPGFGGKNGQGGDFGRFHADEVEFADKKYAFRTLTIRNVEVTGPYFHSGSAGTLHDVMSFHNRGGQGPQDISDATLVTAGVVRHESIRPLNLTVAEIDAVVAFMRTTTAPVQAGPLGIDLGLVPSRVPSGLVPPGIPTPPGPGPFKMNTSDIP